MQFLVAVDGSDPSMEALEEALRFASVTDSSVTAAHVVQPAVYEDAHGGPIATRSAGERSLVVEGVEAAEVAGERVLERADELAADLDREVETVMLYGDPVTELVEYATEEGFGHLFVGHVGRSRRAESMLGSVARSLVERSPVPVSVIR